MKKHFLTLIMAIMCMLLLAIFASAQTYTVSNDAEYQDAYGSASSGDTIVVNGKLTCDIQATKSITYILKADWESSKLVINQSNVEVSFIADGGNYKIMPTNYSTTEGWMNIAQIYENVVINFGGMNGGTLTIDGTNATHDRVSYVSMVENPENYVDVFPDICLNLLSGSAIANFNPTEKDNNVNACILYARTVNMYDGAQIYANKVISAPLFKSCYFNMYGGEIFGNLLTSTRMGVHGIGFIYADKQFTMYDGRIYNNILNAKASSQINVVGFITTSSGYYDATAVVYGGELGDRYVTGTGQNEISATIGTITTNQNAINHYYNTGITVGDRYKFTDTPQLALDQKTGKTIWKVSNTTLDSANNVGFCWNSTKKTGDKAAVFLNAQKKPIAGNNFDTYTVINAYINGVYAHSGSTTIAMPNGYDLWSTDANGYCHTGKAYTLDEVKAANVITLYTASDAKVTTETINGTTKCSICGKVLSCNNPNHELIILSVNYDNYGKQGEKVINCKTCNVDSSVSAPALFTCLGYSAPEDGENSIAIGYTVNKKAISDFESVTKKTLNYGVFAVLKDRLGNNDIFGEDGTAFKGVMNADITSYEFGSFELKIVDFDEYKDEKFAMGVYVATKSGEATEYTYIQSGTINENEKYHFASCDDIINAIPDEIVEFENRTIKAGEEITLPSTVNVNGIDKEVTYSFEGENISIENNVLKGLIKGSETTVTVTGKKITGTFKVNVERDIYKYVVIIGVDGAGTFFKDANTPNIDAIFANGAITYDCLASEETESAQGWGSLLHGVLPSVHGLNNNNIGYSYNKSQYPSFFSVIRDNDENAILASFCNWNSINVGIVEDGIGVHKVGDMSDSDLTNEILAYLEEGNKPTALFVQFDGADKAGHDSSYGGTWQQSKITEIDGYIGQIYAEYAEKGMLDETLFIVTSDHGGKVGTNTHGGLTDEETHVMFAATGKSVVKGTDTIVNMVLPDIAAIVLHALDYENPETWTGKVPSGLFDDVITSGEQPGSTGHELNTYLTFDGDIPDDWTHGKLEFVDGYIGDGVALDNGYITLDDFKPGNGSYTFALWINTKTISSNNDPCIFSNQDWKSGKNLGFTLTIRPGGVSLKLGNGSSDIECTATLPTDYAEDWMHVLAFIDRTNYKIGVCINFGTIVTRDIPEAFRISLDTGNSANIGQDGTGKYGLSLPATVDEFMIFDGVFNQGDVNALKEYYGLKND